VKTDTQSRLLTLLTSIALMAVAVVIAVVIAVSLNWLV